MRLTDAHRGRREGASAEVPVAHDSAALALEDQVVRGSAGTQLGDLVRQEPGEWHDPGLVSLGRVEEESAVVLSD